MNRDMDLKKLEKRIKELESQSFNQKCINTFVNVLMLFIGFSLTILFKKIGF